MQFVVQNIILCVGNRKKFVAFLENMTKLEPDEEQYLKLAHLAGVPMSSSTLKAIKSLCEIGCDPNQIVAAIETIAQNKIKAKEHAAIEERVHN